jgi:hypothetical protein
MEYLPQSFSNVEGQQYPLGGQAGIEHVSRMGLQGRGNLSEMDFAARKIGPTYVCRLEIHRPRDIFGPILRAIVGKNESRLNL